MYAAVASFFSRKDVLENGTEVYITYKSNKERKRAKVLKTVSNHILKHFSVVSLCSKELYSDIAQVSGKISF